MCCSADLDISVSALELMAALPTPSPLLPQHHAHLENIQEFKESFAHYFQQGAAAEQSMVRVNDAAL